MVYRRIGLGSNYSLSRISLLKGEVFHHSPKGFGIYRLLVCGIEIVIDGESLFSG
jgi:hypothetical protein